MQIIPDHNNQRMTTVCAKLTNLLQKIGLAHFLIRSIVIK